MARARPKTPSAPSPERPVVSTSTELAAAPSAPETREREKKLDVVLVHGRTESGALGVLRAREDRVELGVLEPLRHGQPLHGDVVRLTPRPGAPRLYDVDVQLEAPRRAGAASAGDDAASGERDASRGDGPRPGRPAQVATEQYRQNWDQIWSRPKPSAPN